MDLIDLLRLLGLGIEWLPYVLAACTVAGWIVAVVPPPDGGWRAPVWRALNLLAGNVRHATNAADLFKANDKA